MAALRKNEFRISHELRNAQDVLEIAMIKGYRDKRTHGRQIYRGISAVMLKRF